MSKYILAILSVLLKISSVYSKKILIMHPVYSGSHILSTRSIGQELVSRGHQVTVVRWLEANDVPEYHYPNFTEIILSVNNSDGTIPFMTTGETAKFQFPLDLIWDWGFYPSSLSEGYLAFTASCKTLFENENLLRNLKREKFDLAIVDLLYNECELALAAHFLGLHVIGFWGIPLASGEAQYTTAFVPPSIIPHLYFPYSDKMNFFQRVLNTLLGLGSHIIMQYQFSHANFYIQKHLKGCPHPSELLMNISGLLINSNTVFDYPKPLPPSFINIGGFHIKDPNPLTQDLQNFLDSAKSGVILLSLGLTFDSKAIPRRIFEAYFAVFSRLKQMVIVKSSTKPAYVPPNVMVLPYVSQNDILAHPNTVLFITHCGIHGSLEGIYHGVKMVAIPIFFDQINNAARLEDLGVAMKIHKTSTEVEIYDAVTKVLSDPNYERNVKKLSKLFKSTLNDPRGKAVQLIEHVIEYDGADYMKMQSRNLTFIQYFVLDVILFLGLFFSILLFICYNSFKILVNMYFSLTKVTKQKIH